MSADVFIDIRPFAPGQVTIEVSGGGIPAASVNQALPGLTDPEVLAIREGVATPAVWQEVQRKVTDWLVPQQLQLRMNGAPVRLVIRNFPNLTYSIADVPFELAHTALGTPLVLNNRVDSLVHVPHSLVANGVNAARSDWPVRVLIVRANPPDLGGMVPPALSFRDEIMAAVAASLSPNHVRIRVLSREPGSDGPATWDQLRTELAGSSYDVLVFFGHGDLQPGDGNAPPIPVLQLEVENEGHADPVNAQQLQVELHNHRVPLVLLVGCLTAAAPNSIPGAQSMAQALAQGGSGVEAAIGMRYSIDTADAKNFLKAFFVSFLETKPGWVESAVRTARARLHGNHPHPPAWSAPVVFRTPLQEPLFALNPNRVIPPVEDERDQEYRAETWKSLSGYPASLLPAVARDFLDNVLARAEAAVLARASASNVAVVRPLRASTSPGVATRVAVEMGLQRPLRCLRGVVRIDQPARALAATPSPELTAAGFTLLCGPSAGGLEFQIDRATAAPIPLQLFTVDVDPGTAFGTYYLVQIDRLTSEPIVNLRGWNDAVLVPPA